MALKVHHLRPAPGAKTPKTRKGRGEASKGKTSGRGTKGTRARNQVPARFEGGQMPLHMRLPKLKGFTNPNTVTYQVVNVAALGKLFPQGGAVSVADLVAAGAVRKPRAVAKSAAKAASGRAEGPARPTAAPHLDASDLVVTRPARALSRSQFRGQAALRQAIVAREVLGPPLCLRPPRY